MIREKDRLTPKGKKTREKILTTALDMFANSGYHKTTISAICEKAEVAEGTLYLYFKSKDDLMLSSLNTAIESVLTEIDNMLKEEKNPLAKFYAFFEASIKIFKKRPELARLLVIEQFNMSRISINDPTYSGFSSLLDYLGAICREAIDKGYFRELDVNILVLKCHSMIDCILKLWITSDYQTNMYHQKNKMLEMLMYGIVP